MTNTEIVVVLKKICILTGSVLAVAGVLLFVLYFIIYKKIMNGKGQLARKKVLISAVLLCYLIGIYGVTLMNRVEGVDGGTSLQLFYSYQLAWNSYVDKPWRTIILNIIMFVPLGFLLPLCFDACKRLWVTFLCGLAGTLIIEGTQLLTQRGMFETDDIWNNVMGAMIGYGLFILFRVFRSYFQHKAQIISIRKVMLCQIPLLLNLIFFSIAGVRYRDKAFGQLAIAYNVRVDMSQTNLQLETTLSTEEGVQKVYTAEPYEAMEVREYIGKILEQDSGQGKDSHYLAGCSEKKVRAALEGVGVVIPEKATFQEDMGKYIFQSDMIPEQEYYVDGMISCQLDELGQLKWIEDQMVKIHGGNMYTTISEQDAYHQLQKGHFQNPCNEVIRNMKVEGIDIDYCLDSKDFYQPVYSFTCIVNGQEFKTLVPALK